MPSARRWPTAGIPVGRRRRQQRAAHRGRRRVAGAARGARAAAPHRRWSGPRATLFFGETAAELDAGGDELTDDVADTLRELARPAARAAASPRSSRPPGAGLAAPGARPARRRAAAHRPRATSPRCSTRPRTASGSGLPGAARVAARASAERRRAGRAHPPARHRRAPRCRSSPSTPARACSTPSSTCRSPSTATSPSATTLLFHDATAERCLDVGGAGPGRLRRSRRLARAEDAGEELRLTYVALTRAQSQVVTWWAPTGTTANGGLSPAAVRPRARRAARCPTGAGPERRPTREAIRAAPAGRGRAARRRGVAERRPAGARSAPATAARARRPPLRPRRRHRLAPYVVLRADPAPRSRPLGVASEPEVRAPSTTRCTTSLRRRSPPAPARGSATTCRRRWPTCRPAPTFGSLVHGVLEHADPWRPTSRAELAAPGRGAAARGGRSTATRRRPRRGAAAAARTPRSVRSPAGSRSAEIAAARPAARARLRDPARPAATTRGPSADVRLARVAAAAARATCAADDPMRAYADRLEARRSATRRCAATSPARSTSCCGCPVRRATASSSSTTRPTGSATPSGPSTARRLHPDALAEAMLHSALPAAGAALLRRAAPLPALAAARLRPRRPPRRRALPLRARHVRPGDARRSTASRAGCSAGTRRPRWCSSCPTCSTGA